MRRRKLLVGEMNPLDPDPRHALAPLPKQRAGGRLCHRILGLSPIEYLRRFDRANLCESVWDRETARAVARNIVLAADEYDALVLLGRRVCDAFGVDFAPFTLARLETVGAPVVVLPHPSGLCRAWNDTATFERARRLVL